MSQLTPRQREIALLLAQGQNPKQIAIKLGIKRATVYVHLERARRRVDIKSTHVLVVHAAKGADG